MERFITRKQSIMLKGIAIIFMLLHHFFTYPEWYEKIIDYSRYKSFFVFMREPLRLCVPMFAVLTGYAYGNGKELSLKKSVVKVWKFLLNYWIVYICLIIISVVVCHSSIELRNLLLGIVGIGGDYTCFCWYVYFFVIAMVVLPGLLKLLRKSWMYFFILFLLCKAGEVIVLKIVSWNDIQNVLFSCFYYLPYIIIGGAIGEYNIYEKMKKVRMFSGETWYSRIILFICMIISFILPAVIGNDVVKFGIVGFYASIFIYCIVVLNRNKKENKLLLFMGKYATNIWFLHCIYFSNKTKDVFEKILYWPKIPVGVFLWGTMWCLLGAWIIRKVCDWIIKLVVSKKNV